MTESASKPSFIKNSDAELFQQLRKEVNATVSSLKEKRRTNILIKAILFPAIYIVSYLAAVKWSLNAAVYYLCFFMMGFSVILNFLNLIHEAVHNTLFFNKRVNNWYVHLFDLMGANSYIWKVRHIRLHHNYPNVMGWDSDFEQSSMARVFPHAPFSKLHKYQHIYLPLIYPLYLSNWVLVRDFRDFFNRSKLVWKAVDHIPAIEYVKLFLFKAIFFFYTIVLPVIFLHISWAQAITGFLIMIFTASIFSLLVLLSPHASTESEFPIPDENGNMPTGWFRHQLSCTNDVKEDNWFIRFFMGCFNYHIAHHLFPSVNHVFYPEVTQVIRKFAAENNLPYRQFTLVTSLRNHYKLLRTNAFHENIFEETM